MSSIEENISRIQKEIEEICSKVGRDPKEVHLIAVTKTVESDKMNEAISTGIKSIGENKVQEIIRKYDQVDLVDWHMIGHLQTNKVKYIIDKVEMIHSLDRLSLLKEIDKRAKQHNKIMDVLVQVNIANEATKFGLAVNEVEDFFEKIQEFKNICVKGLMGMAPFEEDVENVRKYFRQLKELFEAIKNKKYKQTDMKHLSMGMTNDYKIAIEEGATMIRIGTGIFGKRNYNK